MDLNIRSTPVADYHTRSTPDAAGNWSDQSGRRFFWHREVDGTPCIIRALPAWAERQGLKALTAEEVASLTPEGRGEAAGEVALVRRVENAAAAVNEAAALTARIDALAADIQELAGVVAQIAGPAAAIDDRLSGITARLDDLQDQVNGLARNANPASQASHTRHIPPPPVTPPTSGWLKNLLGRADDEDTPDAPHLAGPANDVGALRNAASEPTAGPHAVIEDRWVKPFARYQVALQAKNGSLLARRSLAEPAARHGVSIDELVERLIAEWQKIEHEIMAEY